jgi:hypothetical protein
MPAKFKRLPGRIVGIFSLLSLFGKRLWISGGPIPRPRSQEDDDNAQGFGIG